MGCGLNLRSKLCIQILAVQTDIALEKIVISAIRTDYQSNNVKQPSLGKDWAEMKGGVG